MPKTAILIDGAFFLKRLPNVLPKAGTNDPESVARTVHRLALAHAGDEDEESDELFRIFFYDCAPLNTTINHPITKKRINLRETSEYKFRMGLHRSLTRLRKVALRLGRLEKRVSWRLKTRVEKEMISGHKTTKLDENDLQYTTNQKQVDMKIGLDVASLAYKKQVSRIVLVSGDSDFVPAAKLARREGIDFILDPMWNRLKPELEEHIDGLINKTPKPAKTS